MCSILCIVSKLGLIEPELETTAKVMLKLAKFRGPDETCLKIIAPNILMGSNRLSIIDISQNGRMPLSDITGETWISYNGEVYNHAEIRKILQCKGVQFQTNTDTEVVLYAYKEWGDSFVEKLNGMFAFVIIDKRHGKVLTGRDRYGIKPLFFYENKDYLVFSSDIRSFLLIPGFSRQLDYDAVSSYMLLRFSPGHKTVLNGVYRINQAEVMTWNIHSYSRRAVKYWSPSFVPSDKSEDELANELVERLQVAVANALTGDVPVAVILSGGLDSATIVALLNQHKQQQITTFTCRFGTQKEKERIPNQHEFTLVEDIKDETYYANLVAEHFSTDHKVFDIPILNDEWILPSMIFEFGEPIASTDALGHFLFSKQLPKNLKVVLSGIGSDEIFGGYTEMYFKKNCHLMRENLSADDYLRLFCNFNQRHVSPAAYLSPDYLNLDYCYSFVDAVIKQFPRAKYPEEHVNELMFFELGLALPGWELDQADRIYMSSSIELRPVFLDNGLVDFALTIPSQFKFNNGIEKYLLKKALRALLPAEIWERKKFPSLGTPKSWYQMKWFETHLKRLEETSLPIWNHCKLRELLRTPHEQRDYDTLFRIVVFEIWHELFISN